jgi:hypothetical protein
MASIVFLSKKEKRLFDYWVFVKMEAENSRNKGTTA